MSSTCFCTLAIHEPYRVRARQLISDAAPAPVVVLTDEPGDFADLPVRAVTHTPTGPMAADYRRLAIRTGGGAGAAAYHDKRFALMAALEDYETAIYVDADSRLGRPPALGRFPPGIALAPGVPKETRQRLRRRATPASTTRRIATPTARASRTRSAGSSRQAFGWTARSGEDRHGKDCGTGWAAGAPPFREG